jgi:hypothetical protein
MGRAAAIRACRAALLLSSVLACGCASYTDATAEARDAYYAHDFERSQTLWTKLLDEGTRSDDAPLLLLERGIVHLAAGRYEAAVADFIAADQRLEILDFSGNPGDVGKYMFSEDSGIYRGPPHEKILVPTLASLACAAAGDHERASTAANAAYTQTVRFEKFDQRANFGSPLANILVGIWAEQRGDTQAAYTAYEAAYALQPLESLRPTLARVLDANAERFQGHWIHKRANSQWGEPSSPGEGDGELIVVVLNGRAPIRAGTSLELTAAQHAYLVTESMLQVRAGYPQANQQEAYNMVAAQRDLPMAVLTPRPSRFAGGSVELPGGQSLMLEKALDVENQVATWDAVTLDTRTAAALGRLIVRLAIRVGTYLVVEKETEDGFLALISSMITGAALEAADTPDTRCWTLLPRHVLFQRCTLPAGHHAAAIVMRGANEVRLERTVDVVAGDIAFALFVVPD